MRNVLYSLEGYRSLLCAIEDAGWTYESFDLTLNHVAKSSTLLLRHDIDAELYLLEPFLSVEEERGASATYFVMLESTFYNVRSSEGRSVLNRIVETGHSVGLHFFGELYAHLEPENLASEIRSQLDQLSDISGTYVQSFSFHQPSQLILSLELEVPGAVNVYSSRIMKSFQYFSDTNMQLSSETLLSLLGSELTHAQLLVHPLWWITEGTYPVDRWRQLLDRLNKVKADHLLQRERTLRGMNSSTLTSNL
jgi:hypothetical protein